MCMETPELCQRMLFINVFRLNIADFLCAFVYFVSYRRVWVGDSDVYAYVLHYHISTIFTHFIDCGIVIVDRFEQKIESNIIIEFWRMLTQIGLTISILSFDGNKFTVKSNIHSIFKLNMQHYRLHVYLPCNFVSVFFFLYRFVHFLIELTKLDFAFNGLRIIIIIIAFVSAHGLQQQSFIEIVTK